VGDHDEALNSVIVNLPGDPSPFGLRRLDQPARVCPAEGPESPL
jgi:hypothetical protein